MPLATTTSLRQGYNIACFIRDYTFRQVRHWVCLALSLPTFSKTIASNSGRSLGQILLLLLLPIIASTQSVNIGIPPIWNYSRKIYRAGTQNWDATQDATGRLYFANNDGLLRYDGTHWSTYPVANHTIVRSVATANDGLIYTGAQSEVGYFSPGADGDLHYTSLVWKLSPGHRTFEDVWDIVFHEKRVFFRTNREVFEWDGDTMRVHEGMGDLLSLWQSGDALILQKADQQLTEYRNGRFDHFARVAGMESAITGLIAWRGDTLLCTTLKNGIFYLTGNQGGKWHTPEDALIAEKRIYAATLLSNGNIALGTSLDGVMILDQGRRLYRHLNKKQGLQNNNILCAYCDRDGNLWLGLDNGIDAIVLESRFSTIFPDDELHATGYTAALFQGKLYLGVSNGAYMAPWQAYYDPMNQPYFRRVANSEGQVWGFTSLPDQLLMGHHEGAFEITGPEATLMSPEPGTWTYVQLSGEYLLAGSYTGLTLYKKSKSRWVPDGKIKGIQESCRIMVRDQDGSVWVSHPYRGLYHIIWSPEKKWTPDIKFFDQSGGLPGNLNNYVFSIAGKAVFGTEKGVYRFDARQSRFFPDTSFNSLIGGDQRVKSMKEDQAGNIWYVTDREVGLLEVEDDGLKKSVRKKTFPELQGKLVGGFEFIYPVDAGNVIFGTEEGFVLYDAQPVSAVPVPLQIVLQAVRIIREPDSLLYGGYPAAGTNMRSDRRIMLASDLNSLSFSFSATDYRSPSLLRYRTWMEGLEDSWSPWTSDTRRDFSSLGPGDYVFHAQARITEGRESREITYAFTIRPPWYKSTGMKVLFGTLFVSFFAGLIIRQQKKFETEKARMTETHQEKEARAIQEAEISKAALNEIRHEKLEVEIKYKNQELALTTMHLVQKAEMLLTVQEALKQMEAKTTSHEVKKEVHQLLNLVNFDVKLDEDWEHFAHHFDQVHVDFLKHLQERFPQLSASDLKLCAYLRMNLSTKEIAPLLNISVRGVEGSRYRLRKKLGLPNDTNLTDFILRFSA